MTVKRMFELNIDERDLRVLVNLNSGAIAQGVINGMSKAELVSTAEKLGLMIEALPPDPPPPGEEAQPEASAPSTNTKQ